MVSILNVACAFAFSAQYSVSWDTGLFALLAESGASPGLWLSLLTVPVIRGGEVLLRIVDLREWAVVRVVATEGREIPPTFLRIR